MTRIALISDTHGDLPEDVIEHLNQSDEVWHAGDIGNIDVTQYLHSGIKFRAVYGNIDGLNIRREYPENQLFGVDGLKVFITHIGGYPPRYVGRVRALLEQHKPDIYICGHSHILKVMRDHKLDLLHMNPGACGHKGFHSLRTMLLFNIDAGKISDLRAVELGRRGRFQSNA